MLIESDCKIPGVSDNVAFEKWLTQDARIRYNYVTLKESALGGIGLFYSTATKSDAANDRELLRISLKYDYKKLLEVLSRLIPENSAIIKAVITSLRPESETSILQCYFIGFKICAYVNSAADDAVLSEYLPYLDILCHTNVDDITVQTNGHETTDKFLSTFINRGITQYKKYERLKKELRATVKDKTKIDLLEFKEFKQIEAAIRSRVLEIPYEAEDEDSDQEEGGYYTDVTLVPLLDFVNHSSESKKNAYFDVDKSTGEILLLLNEDVEVKDGMEISICYSPNENIQSMIHTYGFIPERKDTIQLFEIILPSNFLNEYLRKYNGGSEQDYALILKWLQIFPIAQLVLLDGKVYINYFSNLLPLAMVKGLTYDANWETTIFSEGSTYGDIDDAERRAKVIETIKLQEKGYDIIMGVDQKAVRLDNEYPTYETILSIANLENNDDFLKLQDECTKMIYAYCKETILRRTEYLLKELSIHEPGSSSSLLKKYVETEIGVLKKVVEEFEKGTSLTLPEEIAEEDWEQERTGPSTYFQF